MMDRPPRARSRRHPDGKGRARNKPVVTRLNLSGSAVAQPAAQRRDVDRPRIEHPVAERRASARPGPRADYVAVADVPRPWWFARAMYGLVAMVGLGTALVWLSTGGVIAIVVTVVAVATAIPAITLARREPREPPESD